MLRQRLIDRDAAKGVAVTGHTANDATNSQLAAPTSLAITQGKDSLIVIQPDPATNSDFDSALGGGISIYTRSSRASQSDFEFSESYL